MSRLFPLLAIALSLGLAAPSFAQSALAVRDPLPVSAHTGVNCPSPVTTARYTLEVQYAASSGLSGLSWRARLPEEAAAWISPDLWTAMVLRAAEGWRKYLPVCGTVFRADPPPVCISTGDREEGFLMPPPPSDAWLARTAWRKNLPVCGTISLDDPTLPYLNWRERDHLFVEPPSDDWLAQPVATSARQVVPLETAGLTPTLHSSPSGRMILEFELPPAPAKPAPANPAEDRLLQGIDRGIAFVF